VTYYIWALLKTKCAVEFKYHVNEDVPEFHYDKDGRLTEEYEYDIDGFPVPH
jgi:hypothetical protein